MTIAELVNLEPIGVNPLTLINLLIAVSPTLPTIETSPPVNQDVDRFVFSAVSNFQMEAKAAAHEIAEGRLDATNIKDMAEALLSSYQLVLSNSMALRQRLEGF